MTQSEQQIFAKVADCFVEALGADDDEVTMDAKVIDDLGAESLDFLDIVFRLERAFDIKIPRGDTENRVKESMDGDPYEIDGVLTERALVSLRTAMPEVPEDEIQPGLRTKDIPGLFRVATFHNMVVGLLSAKAEQAAA